MAALPDAKPLPPAAAVDDHHLRGLLHLVANERAAAQNEFLQAQAKGPSSPGLYWALAIAQRRLCRWSALLATGQAWAELEPDSPAPRQVQARAWVALGSPAKALALVANDTSDRGRLLKSLALSAMQEPEQAQAALSKIPTESPTLGDPELLLTLPEPRAQREQALQAHLRHAPDSLVARLDHAALLAIENDDAGLTAWTDAAKELGFSHARIDEWRLASATRRDGDLVWPNTRDALEKMHALLERLVQRDPTRWRTHLLHSALAIHLNRPEVGVILSAGLKPVRFEIGVAHQTLGSILFREGRIEAGLLALEHGLGLAPNLKRAQNLSIMGNYRRGLASKGGELLTTSKDRGQSPLAPHEIAELYLFQGLTAVSTSVLAKSPNAPPSAELTRGITATREGRFQDALPRLTRLAAAAGDDPSVRYLVGWAQALAAGETLNSGSTLQRQRDELLSFYEEEVAADRVDLIASDVSLLLRANPNDMSLLAYRSRLRLMQGFDSLATRDLRQVLSSPEHAWTNGLLETHAIGAIRLNRMELALTLAHALEERNSDGLVSAHLVQAFAAQRLGLHARAVAHTTTGLGLPNLTSEERQALRAVQGLLEASSDPSKALDALEDGLALLPPKRLAYAPFPRVSRVLACKGSVLLKLQRADEAEQAFRQALAWVGEEHASAARTAIPLARAMSEANRAEGLELSARAGLVRSLELQGRRDEARQELSHATGFVLMGHVPTRDTAEILDTAERELR